MTDGTQAPPERLAGIDPTLYLVTDPAQCAAAGRSVADTVAEAVAGGAGIVQVRDKDASDEEFAAVALAVLEAVARVRERSGIAARVPVFLNDRLDVAARLRADGHDVHIHVGQSDAPPAKVRARLGPAPLLGLSAATAEEFAVARATGAVDLVGIGPAFDTSTKADAPAGLGAAAVAELAGLAAAEGLPSVAIGGIDAEGAAALRRENPAAGLIGVCAVSAICSAADPRAAAAALRTAFLTGTTN